MKFEAIPSPYLVPFDGKLSVADLPTAPPPEFDNKQANKAVRKTLVQELRELQRVLYADDRFSLLLIFQALDAAGKDSTIRSVFTGVNPAGFQVFNFKQPSKEELDHDFLWRTTKRLPERGRIGIFNRSYYEETLVVRVHPEYLEGQKLPHQIEDMNAFWEQRYESIRDQEAHLARNGTVVLKFWLNVSKEEQKQRFLSRLDIPEKNWKFSVGDVKERSFWPQYMEAYQAMLNATSRPWAPWYAIPADSKSYMRRIVAAIIVESLRSLNMQYPVVEPKEMARFEEMRAILEQE